MELEAGLCPLQPLNLCFFSSGSKVIAEVSGEEVMFNLGGLNRVCVPRKRALDTDTHKDSTEVSSVCGLVLPVVKSLLMHSLAV